MKNKSAVMENPINADFWFSQHQHSGGIFMSAEEAESAVASAPAGMSVSNEARSAGVIAGRFAGAVEIGADDVVEGAGADSDFDTIDSPQALLGWLLGWLIGYRAVKTAR